MERFVKGVRSSEPSFTTALAGRQVRGLRELTEANTATAKISDQSRKPDSIRQA